MELREHLRQAAEEGIRQYGYGTPRAMNYIARRLQGLPVQVTYERGEFVVTYSRLQDACHQARDLTVGQ